MRSDLPDKRNVIRKMLPGKQGAVLKVYAVVLMDVWKVDGGSGLRSRSGDLFSLGLRLSVRQAAVPPPTVKKKLNCPSFSPGLLCPPLLLRADAARTAAAKVNNATL